jgi:hypothetical protein
VVCWLEWWRVSLTHDLDFLVFCDDFNCCNTPSISEWSFRRASRVLRPDSSGFGSIFIDNHIIF